MVAEVSAGSGPADAEHQSKRKGNRGISNKYYKTYCFSNTKHKFKRLHEAWFMLQKQSRKRSHWQVIPSSLDAVVACKRRPFDGDAALT